jgi:hypothetical protein
VSALLIAGTPAAVLIAPTPAAASTRQLAMFEEDMRLLSDPSGTIRTLRELGVSTVRLFVHWSWIAPHPNSRARPRHFDAADPSAYPANNWAPYDAVIEQAHRAGIQIELLVSGPAPRWATGRDAPRGALYGQWKPSASQYGQFVDALGTRYGGNYRPRASSAVLPRVSFWEIWNEANFGENLAPQATHGSRVPSSPRIYRGLLDAAWSALGRTGHGGDTVLIGSLSPRGFNGPPSPRFPEGLPGNFSTSKPLQFIRALYCVDSGYRQLRGGAAAAVGCPASASGSRRFRGQHPGLFRAHGFGIHPYPYNLPPTRADSYGRDPDVVEFSLLSRLTRTLDRLQRIYRSPARPSIYNTEYGYITDPPNRSTHYGSHFLSPAKAAAYINWAEYLSWRNPRLASYMQYLLFDPRPHQSGFATGLITSSGRVKPAYYAYRMPIFLPRTSARRGWPLEVWGCVRPAHFAALDTGRAQTAAIQLRHGAGAFQTLTTVAINQPQEYFDLRVAFPASGAVRVAWTDPFGRTIYSREVAVTVS